MYKRPETRTVEIANGGTESGVIGIQDYAIAGVITPDALTGTALTFKAASAKDGTFVDVYDSDGNQVSATATADRAIGLSASEADALAPWQWVKVVSNAPEAADRTLTLVLK